MTPMVNDCRILLLTDVPPCKNYSSGLMNRRLVKFLLDEKKEVFCYAVMSRGLIPEYDTDILSEIRMTIVERPEENLSRSDKQQCRNYYRRIEKIADHLVKYIRENHIDKVWCPIQGEVMLLLLQAVMKKTDVFCSAQVWDPIEWWMEDNDYNEHRQKKTLSVFRKVMQRADSVMTASPAMTEYFSREYDATSYTMFAPLDGKQFKTRKTFSTASNTISIGIAGQIYARDAFDAFLTALDKMDWAINGCDINVLHFGKWVENYVSREKHPKLSDKLILKGEYDQQKLLTELRQCSYLYCPYFFEEQGAKRKVSELSFPSKLISYLAVEVPVILHAPDYSSPYIFSEAYNCANLVSTIDPAEIKNRLSDIFSNTESAEMSANEAKAFEENFTEEAIKNNFMQALQLEFDGKKKLKVLEVNNIDLSGRRFNGYDLMEYLKNETPHRAKQIVNYKQSDNPGVIKLFNSSEAAFAFERLRAEEVNCLSVHSQLSLTSDILLNNDSYLNSDLVHFHLVHNMGLSISQMADLCRNKPSIWTFHDFWNFSGRCVFPQTCEEWKSGCKECKYLDTLFPFSEDNCSSLWELKKKLYGKLDIDVVVTTPYMTKAIEQSPIGEFAHVHVIPFGIDLEKFSNTVSKEEARKKLGIAQGDIVIFFRAQMAMKGTEYVIEALKMLDIDSSNITLVSCSETGVLGELADRYKIIELGQIQDEQMILAYNACDMFLMPSRAESFGLMAIEAMACARPIVIFDNTALPYVTFAPECGILVENKNSRKLMEAVRDLILNPEERERRGKLGRKLAEENYDVRVYNQRIRQLYEEVYARHMQDDPVIPTESKAKIDYDRADVKYLIGKLKLIYSKTFPGEQLKADFLHCCDWKGAPKVKVDYSDDGIQELLRSFNLCLYERIKECNSAEIIAETFSDSVDSLFTLFRTDRHELLVRISKKFAFNSAVYAVARWMYHTARGFKHFICNDNYKRLAAKVELLEAQVYYLENKIDQLESQSNDLDD